MAYPVAFFEPQIRLARLLSERFDLALADALLHYTTATRNLGVTDEEWLDIAPALLQAADLAGALHAEYERRRPPDPQPGDSTFYGRPLFGCFSYGLRDGGVIRPHFVANDQPSLRPLSVERVDVRRDELRRLFAHVQAHVPDAQVVQGNSWLYNTAWTAGSSRRPTLPIARRATKASFSFWPAGASATTVGGSRAPMRSAHFLSEWIP